MQFDSKIIELYNNNTFKSCCRDVDSYRLVYESMDSLGHNRHGSISNRENYSADTRNIIHLPEQERNFEIIRMESGRESENNGQVIEDGLNMDENFESPRRS